MPTRDPARLKLKHQRDNARRARRRSERHDWRSGSMPRLGDATPLVFDGEGVTDHAPGCDGLCQPLPDLHEAALCRQQVYCRHRYVLLADSDGRTLWAAPCEALRTITIFDFLLASPPGRLCVGYSVGYDVVKWLADVPPEKLKWLHRDGWCFWNGYRIEYTPRREFVLKHGRTGERSRGGGYRWKRTFRMVDIFGNFQQAFTSALDAYQVGDDATVRTIQAMKDERPDFGDLDPLRRQQIERYCLEECRLAVTLFEKLRDAARQAGIRPRKWYGAGSLAAALLNQHDVKRCLADEPSWARDAVLTAYYGGRFDTTGAGYVGPCYDYDIRSAYPTFLQDLPCLAHATWMPTDHYDPEPPWALWAVVWRVPEGTPWPPFPLRYDRRILYPLDGQGWYHASEVAAAVRWWGLNPRVGPPAPGECGIRVLRGFVIRPGCDEQPFAFVPEVFDERTSLKAQGQAGHQVLKLALNSLYGKTAQRKGYRGQQPPYRSFTWAGLVTAATRAYLLDTIRQNPRAVVAVATDGLISREKLPVPLGEGLGQWKEEACEDAFIAKSGVYQFRDANGWQKPKTRGLGPREVDMDAVRASFAYNPAGEHTTLARRFVGLGAGARANFPAACGNWVGVPITIQFRPEKRGWAESPPPGQRWVEHHPHTTGFRSARPIRRDEYAGEDMPDEAARLVLALYGDNR